GWGRLGRAANGPGPPSLYGNTLNDKLRTQDNRIDKLRKLRHEGMSAEGLIDEIYLSSLARFPTSTERSHLLALLPPQGDPSNREIVEDLFWGLLSSREFLFNH